MTMDARSGLDAPLKMWVRALERTAPIATNPWVTLPALIDDLADKFGAGAAFDGEGGPVSYRDLAQRCNRYTRWAVAQGLGKGDVVCLFMRNDVDYMAIWLGICRAGVTVALVNTNLIGAQLAHSIRIADPTHIIVGNGLLETMIKVLPDIGKNVRCWTHNVDGHGLPRIDQEIQILPGGRLYRSEVQPLSIKDRALYIYTSGTTGLPKAAYVSHMRLMQWSYWFAGMMDTRPTDRMYNCLPMYHSIGGVAATGALLVNGGAVVVRTQFSAGRFWDEVVQWKCTLFQYIGELCRYLVNRPPHPQESKHQIRLCCGNGLRSDVWETFQQRFHIPKILEFYAATEGNFSLYNCEGKSGSVGRIPSFLVHRFPIALIKLDNALEEPVRDAKGFCTHCGTNQTGEMIGQIDEDHHTGSRFEGYLDHNATEGKILRDVFAKGDAWFRSGDLMRQDEKGYYYFVDRIGDTFRWKGENVSTTEVAEIINAGPGVSEAIVYGVSIPGTEGRAGMVAAVVTPEFSLAAFHGHLLQHLPDYARPLFLRIRDTIKMTGTFKPNKHELREEAYNPELITDPLYFDDRSAGAFVILDHVLCERIQSGKLRL